MRIVSEGPAGKVLLHDSFRAETQFFLFGGIGVFAVAAGGLYPVAKEFFHVTPPFVKIVKVSADIYDDTFIVYHFFRQKSIRQTCGLLR